ncbi:MAG: hypothetical protein E4H14_06720 [Candidatus Thorarchaeota archaeon]|nr:MAG: hypothetical protein E4H14_06720 [Candidatus Thorarchaeota archaeon]
MPLQGFIPVTVKGHCKIVDDLGNVLLNKSNAVHPQNMARVIARALSNEHNYFINRIAFGNGGTIVDAAFTITYKTPNDGQPPDVNTWDSRIYNETYSEIINAGQNVLNPELGTDPGSADLNTGVRTGGGAVPSSDPPSVPHVSGPGVRSSELGLSSEIIVTAVLNGDEPLSQLVSDTNPPTENTETDFTFDEIGLYTSGAQAIDTSGYVLIDVGVRNSLDDSGLLPSTAYSFDVSVDGGISVVIAFTTPAAGGSGAGGQILYGDLCQAINTGDVTWSMSGVNPMPGGAVMAITDDGTTPFTTISGKETFGYLRIESGSAGATSAVDITGAQTTAFLTQLNPPVGASVFETAQGTIAGVQNAPTAPTTERERLLAHLIFSPVLKASNRTLIITYTLTVSVARTPS